MSLARAFLSDLDAVHNLLHDPLTGRNVMIPFTSKAFFAGTLQPAIMEKFGDQECVTVKLSKDTLVDMSRLEALDLIQKRMQSFTTEVGEVKQTKTKRKPPAKEAVETHLVDESPVGFFEIREEYDDSGNEIRAEAINVAKELEFLEKGDDTNVSSLLRKPVKWNDDDGDISTTDELNSGKNDRINTNPVVVNERDFEKLSLRLEELARLEAEAEADKAINQKSSKKIQGSGWAKGFLNRPPPKRSTKSAGDQASPTIPNDTPRTKQVKFGATDIREIPPRGGTSAHVLPSPPPLRQSISNQVFTGVVAERPAGKEHDRIADAVVAPPVTERKLSRFAQQRLEQRQDGSTEATSVSRLARDKDQIR